MLDPIFRQINISVHSFSANFPDQDPKLYMQRVFKFTRLAMTERPDLYINYRLWDTNDPKGEVGENQSIRDYIGAEFAVDLHQQTIDIRRRKGYLLAGRVYVNYDTRFEWPNIAAPLRSTKGFCHGLGTHIGIHADGTVVPCCLDKEANIDLGNCTSTPLESILAGERATAMRDGFANRRLVEDLCQRCTFIERFDR